MTFAIAFPALDPIAIQVGPLAIRWYALAYIAGIVLGWRYAIRLVERPPIFMDRTMLDDFIVWATVGIILGGRSGYVLFYKPSYYLANPQEILALWHGGMSFHGGLIGVVSAIILFALKRGLPILALGDVIACVAPIGLFFGRIANFVNGELWGRETDLPWGMIFPNGGPVPRHPSQLYEAGLEGVVLFTIMAWAASNPEWRRKPGLLTGLFLTGYSLARSTCEFFREPDSFLGFIIGPFTMGQLLSLPMLVIGLYLIVSSGKRKPLGAAG